MNLDNEDWSIVGYSSNPVPGSSIDVREIARAYTNRRDSFSDMASILRRLGDEGSGLRGEWIREFKQKAQQLPDDFTHFSEGFDSVQRALTAWADDMEVHQKSASQGLQAAKTANANISAWSNRVDDGNDSVRQARQKYNDAPEDASASQLSQLRRARDNAESLLASYERQLSNARDDLENAKRTIRNAKESYDADAERCATSISGAQQDTPNVEWYEVAFYSDAWQITVRILQIASVIVAVASLFVSGWGIALLSAALAAALAVNKICEAAAGDATWGEAIVEVLFAAITIIPNVKLIYSGIRKLPGAQGLVEQSELTEKIGKGLNNVFSGKTWSDIKKTGGVWKNIKEYGSKLGKNVKTSWRHIRMAWHQLKSGWNVNGVHGVTDSAKRLLHNYLLNKVNTSDDFRDLSQSFSTARNRIKNWHPTSGAGAIDNVKDALKTAWNAAGRSHLWQHAVPYITATKSFFSGWASDGTPFPAFGDSILDSLKNLIPGYETYSDVQQKWEKIWDNGSQIERILR